MKKIMSILCILILLFLIACSKSDVKPPEVSYQAQNEYMNMAIKEAREGIYNHHGGPFGSVIVKDGKVVGSGHNMVL